MTENRHKPDEFEQLLAEFASADAAGVFRQTPHPVDTGLVASGSARLARPRWLAPRRLVPVAAAAVVAFCVWGWLFQRELDAVRGRAQLRNAATLVTDGGCDAAFLQCFGGSANGTRDCAAFDFDHDGDVDLADYGIHQVTCNRVASR